ncbi:BCS1 N terminal-domain-containing protein, partial [Aspergillus cavernicola]
MNAIIPYQASLVDIFFPGFSFISTSAQQLLAGNLNGFTRLLCACGIFVLFARYAFNYISDVVRNYFTSTIHVSYYDEAYDMLVDWIAHQQFVGHAHSLIARVGSSRRTVARGQSKKKLVTFSPWDGSFPFWYKGHLLTLHCAVKEHREDIYISSIGRSPNILKDLIEECRRDYLNVIHRKVSVFEHQEGEWKRAQLRPVRPISTVIMDEQVKNGLVKDMEEFLDEPTQR